MIRVLIVDDEPLPRERIRTLLAGHDVEIVGECRDGLEAVQAIRRLGPDLVFLDVQMPGLDGFGVLDAVAGGPLPAVIFVTAYDAYAVRAFEASALDYLLKPIRPDRFEQALARALRQYDTAERDVRERRLYAWVEQLRADQSYTRRFVVEVGGRLHFVRVDEIDWVGAADNYVTLHAAGGRSYLLRRTLTAVEAELPPDRFVRVHRSLLINVDRVASVEPHTHGEYVVTMHDGTRLTTSRSYSHRLRRLLS
jgi:two-component system LytT family response regulator